MWNLPMDLEAAAGRRAPAIAVRIGRNYATRLVQRTLSICSGDVERLAAGERQLVSERKSAKANEKAGICSFDVRDRQRPVLLEYVTITLLLGSSLAGARVHGVGVDGSSVRGPAQVHRVHKRINDGEIPDFERGRDDGSGQRAAFGDALFAV
jgi:hypothetical protein